MTIAERVVAETLTWISTPYQHQARLKGAGVDCLNLVVGVYENVTRLPTEPQPPYARDWALSDNGELMLDAANRYLVPVAWKQGDAFEAGQVIIVRWKKTQAASHAAIVITPDTMVHSYFNLNTQLVTIPDFWRKLIAGVYTFPEVI